MADLTQWQEDLRRILGDRGFGKHSPEQELLLLIEEVGELAKAMRKRAGLKLADDTERKQIEEEAADVFIVLIGLCNQLDIDLEKAVIAKEKINSQREWK